MTRSLVRKWSPLAGVLLLAGCMSYIPTDPGELPVGSNVRVQISRQAFADLPQISDRQGQRLEGALVRRGDSDLTIRIPIEIGSPLGQELTVPLNGVVISELREVSRPRTLLAAAAGLAVVIGIVIGPGGNAEGATGSDDGTNTSSDEGGFSGVSSILRLLRFSIPIP